MEEIDMSLGGLEHSKYYPPKHADFRWRAFANGRKKAMKSRGFIDGDFVEGFLDLEARERDKCCVGIEGGVEEVGRLVEELSRLH